MKEHEKQRLMEWGKRLITKNGGDYMAFDFDAEVDSSLNYYEAKNIIKEKIKSLYEIQEQKRRADFKGQQLMLEQAEKKAIRQEEEKAEIEFMKSLEEIENDRTSKIIEEVYYAPKSMAKMVVRGNSTGLLLWGKGGLGKTYSIIRAFKEEGVDFVYSCGFSTTLQFYNFLYNNRDKNIIFDDISNILKSYSILDLLKSALYSPKGVRIVHYGTTSPKLSVPSKFEFTGTITILINQLRENNEDLKAVADRILSYELKMDYKDIIKVIFELARQEYKNLTKEERFKIANWIKDNTTPATENLNLRLLFKVYEIFRYDKENWEKLAGKTLINNEKMLEVKKLLEKYNSVKEAEKEFIEIGLGCRKTFYNIKQKIYK